MEDITLHYYFNDNDEFEYEIPYEKAIEVIGEKLDKDDFTEYLRECFLSATEEQLKILSNNYNITTLEDLYEFIDMCYGTEKHGLLTNMLQFFVKQNDMYILDEWEEILDNEFRDDAHDEWIKTVDNSYDEDEEHLDNYWKDQGLPRHL